MIISASRRTDIPNYYSDWFFERVNEGKVLISNPVNKNQVSMISLSPDVIDGIVFWTKNPKNMLPNLKKLDNKYMYYFQFTLNSYGSDLEPNIPSKKDVIIPTFIKLAKHIGKERVIWRYDPIIITRKYTIEYHLHYFNLLAKLLSSYTDKCVFSFLDFYRKTKFNMKDVKTEILDELQMRKLVSGMAKIAKSYGLLLESCSEKFDFSEYGVKHGCCIDKVLFEKLLNCKLNAIKDQNQREHCGCIESIDIGQYDTCMNGCKYCYANNSLKNSLLNEAIDPDKLLFDEYNDKYNIKEKKMKSFIEYSLFNLK